MPEYAAVLAEFIVRVGVDRPHLVGNSFGGTLALQLAIEHPGIVRSAVGIGTYAGWSGSFPPQVVAQRLSQTVPDLDLPPDKVASKWVPGFVTPSAPEFLKRELHELIAGFDPAGMRPMIRALAEADLSDSISDVNVPTLLIWGDQDVRSPIAVGHELQTRIPGGRLEVVPCAGHLTQLEAGEAVNSLLKGFFTRVAAAPAGLVMSGLRAALTQPEGDNA
jgi:pimeloyl-ACP methyl ester carboxylesterase